MNRYINAKPTKILFNNEATHENGMADRRIYLEQPLSRNLSNHRTFNSRQRESFACGLFDELSPDANT